MIQVTATGAAGLIGVGLALAVLGLGATASDEPGKGGRDGAVTGAPLPSVGEARERARLLHDTVHDTLQLVHAQYYREDEGLAIPAATLKRLFGELAERRRVRLRWLVVDARAMNVEHNPRDDFEKQAVAALNSGKDEYEQSADGVYRHVGRVTLGSECLKCHLPNRTSNKNRTAGLVISMPIGAK